MNRILPLVIAALLFSVISCSKDSSCSQNEVFCNHISNEDFDATGPLINDYLLQLKKGQDAKSLEKLADWLECKSCVEKASVLCNSCIETFPEMSELKIVFSTNGKKTTKILDIRMSEPMEFVRYHD